MQRKLIHNPEGKISVLQICGFIVILSALVYLFVIQIFFKLNGEIIATDFFAIMLGFAFAFPDLLMDANNGLSTMRLVVFMMINVICLLLLKIGWAQTSLSAIGLDQYWMGVIAFVFGAKATQSYFESKLAVPSPTPPAPPAPLPPAPPPGPLPAPEELDGCSVVATTFTADADLPASKGGVA